MPIQSNPSAKNEMGEFDRFTDFMRQLISVPHSEIKAKRDAEKRAKKRNRTSKASTSASARAVRASHSKD